MVSLAPPLQPFDAPSRAAQGWWTVSSDSECGLVLPDGHSDVVVRLGGFPILAGPDTTAQPVTSSTPGIFVGVRLQPGAAAAMIGDTVATIRNKRIPLTDLDRSSPEVRRGLEALEPLSDASSAAAVLEAIVDATIDAAWTPDGMVVAAVAAIQRCESLDRIGIGERQLRRRFSAALGYGPSFLRRIVRLDRFVSIGDARSEMSLAQQATMAGYYDHAHLANDCAQIAGCTPTQLLQRMAVEGSS